MSTAGHAPADALAAVLHRTRRGIAVRPAERFGARSVGFAEAPRRPWFAAFGIDVRLVAQTQLHRVEVELDGELVHRTFEREGTRVLARCAESARQDGVHRNDPLTRAEVRDGVHHRGDDTERLDEHRGGGGLVRAVMIDGEKLPVFCGAELQRLPRCRSPAIGGEGLRPRHRELHRSPQNPGGDDSGRRVRQCLCLGSESTANER